MEQTVVLISSSGYFDVRELQGLLDAGWRIVTISSPSHEQYSKWLVVLEKHKS